MLIMKAFGVCLRFIPVEGWLFYLCDALWKVRVWRAPANYYACALTIYSGNPEIHKYGLTEKFYVAKYVSGEICGEIESVRYYIE